MERAVGSEDSSICKRSICPVSASSGSRIKGYSDHSAGCDPGCVKTLRGIIAPGILGSMVMRRAKKRKNLSSARHYDQIRFRFHTTKQRRGRPKGAKNKRTAAREAATKEIAAQIEKSIGGAFEGDALAYLMSIYKDPSQPENVRIDAAKAAICDP